MQSRYYDSEVGRFVNGDDSGYLGTGKNTYKYNMYLYCGCNPVEYLDIDGHASFANSIKGNKVTTKIYFWLTTIKYKWYFKDGIIKIKFDDNEYWSLVWRGETGILAEAMYKGFKKKYGFNIHRTIGSIAVETLLHYGAYKLKIAYGKAKVADIGGCYKYNNRYTQKNRNWGYDSNAIYFEGANALNIALEIRKRGLGAASNMLKRIKRYF